MFWTFQNLALIPMVCKLNKKNERMKAYNKGGRPTKSLVEKRTYRVNLKMNTEEYYTLKARASEAEVSPCDFIRAIIRKAEIKQRLSPEWMDHIRKLSGMAKT